ncbi:hypothetical protein CSA17_07260 [bacterium DOLJORAL78_65_58]|nr:MAG: hypothetical protein CSA17_07260 [bacterium DOLJORAL78_65_58]
MSSGGTQSDRIVPGFVRFPDPDASVATGGIDRGSGHHGVHFRLCGGNSECAAECPGPVSDDHERPGSGGPESQCGQNRAFRDRVFESCHRAEFQRQHALRRVPDHSGTRRHGHGNTVHASHNLQDYRAEYACRYVLAHYSENINRDKMAEMVNLSPGYFSNLFRSEVGMSFSDYLIQVRIDSAKGLLRRFDLSVEAISKKCGFNSLAHFSRTFKDRCGLSPLKYRKSPHLVN